MLSKLLKSRKTNLILLFLFSLTVFCQSQETILLGDSRKKAKEIALNISNLDSDFKFEEYKGQYEGFDEDVVQYMIWADDMLFLNVLTVNDKVVFIMTLTPDPMFQGSKSQLDKLKEALRSNNAGEDHKFFRDNTYKKFINGKFYSYGKYLVLYGPKSNPAKENIPYTFDSLDFNALQEITRLFVKVSENKLNSIYL